MKRLCVEWSLCMPLLCMGQILAILTTRGSAGWTQFGAGGVVYGCTCVVKLAHKLLPIQYAVQIVTLDRTFGGELDVLQTFVWLVNDVWTQYWRFEKGNSISLH